MKGVYIIPGVMNSRKFYAGRSYSHVLLMILDANLLLVPPRPDWSAPETANMKVRRRGLLVVSRARTCLLDVETCDLQEGQSRAHKFNIGPYDGVNRESNSPGPEAGEARHRSAAQVGGMGCPEMREVVCGKPRIPPYGSFISANSSFRVGLVFCASTGSAF